ncbi:aldehyde reductase [Leifsonia shinshuensis]|uniref:SDR family oxidoreductase n=1 Tax=Leifsonia shinshuensis TaxID=150026 RepID=UPI001F50A1DE|nr:aldehyde reductase [Leifsonia shinshuensis]MCI0159059.1 aldehyde reductase [Leifsonia shinshuensis]
MADRVLVTGGSGFVGAHCVLAALEAGYDVRTTIRSPQRAADVRAQLAAGAALGGTDSADAGDRVEFAIADLLDDAGWSDAVAGCRFVLHVASPFPMTEPKDPDELVRPAREGALRVLRAARDAGVERVVLTSSFAAIGYGHAPTKRPFTEVDWTELDSGRPISAYVRSKTLAERAAWAFIAEEGGHLQLATVNPVGILGPVLGPDYSSSVELVKLVKEGRLPRLPDVYFGVVDVRDVAGLHLLAMTRPEAAGERFLATAGDALSAPELALLIRGHLGSPAGDRVRTGVMPTWVVKAAAPFSRRVRGSLADIGVYRNGSSHKARSVLGWEPRSREEAVFATVDSLPPRLR